MTMTPLKARATVVTSPMTAANGARAANLQFMRGSQVDLHPVILALRHQGHYQMLYNSEMSYLPEPPACRYIIKHTEWDFNIHTTDYPARNLYSGPECALINHH